MSDSVKIEKRFLQNLFYVFAIFTVLVFLIIYHNGIKNLSYNNIDINTLINITINPDCNNQNVSPQLKDFYKSYCNKKLVDDLNFFEFIFFILSGISLVCYYLNNKIILFVSENIDNIANTTKQSPFAIPVKDKYYNILPIILIYIFLDLITMTVKERFLEIYKAFDGKINRANSKTNFAKEYASNIFSLISSIVVLLIVINCFVYIIYLGKGALYSENSKLTYVSLIVAMPFLMSMVGFNLTAIDGFTNFKENFEDYFEDVKENFEDYFEDVKENFEDYYEDVKENFEDYYEDVKENFTDYYEGFKNNIEGFIEGNKNSGKKKGGGGGKKGGGGGGKKKGGGGGGKKKGGGKKTKKKKNKSKRKRIRKTVSKTTKKFVNCKSYNYIWYLLGFFIIPICVALYIIGQVVLIGLTGIMYINETVMEKIKNLFVISLILLSLIFCWILFEKALNIMGYELPKVGF